MKRKKEDCRRTRGVAWFSACGALWGLPIGISYWDLVCDMQGEECTAMIFSTRNLWMSKYVQNSPSSVTLIKQRDTLGNVHLTLTINSSTLLCSTNSHRNHFKQNFLFSKTFAGFGFSYSIGKSICPNKPDYSYSLFVWFDFYFLRPSLYQAALAVLALTIWTSHSQRSTCHMPPCSTWFFPFLVYIFFSHFSETRTRSKSGFWQIYKVIKYSKSHFTWEWSTGFMNPFPRPVLPNELCLECRKGQTPPPSASPPSRPTPTPVPTDYFKEALLR